MYKFGTLEKENEVEFKYQDIWCIERYPNFSRGVVAPSGNHIGLMLQIAKNYPPPYWVLYILVLSRQGQKPGRYQCPSTLSFSELEQFCSRFKDFLETDGRHHFWIASAATNQMLVYDRHNVIYIYDQPENIRDFFRNRQYNEEVVKYPVPHCHRYNEQNDQSELDIISYCEWIRTDLEENDEV